GTYTLHEVTAPDGYEVATDITFVIEKGKLTTVDSNAVAEDDVIVMVDEATKATVKIDKQDVFGEEVEGATLTLTGKDKNGNTVTFEEDSLTVGGNGTAVKTSGEALTWISGNGVTEIGNLPDGTYTLHEVTAPDGYEVATDITFVIEKGKLTTVDSNTVAEDEVIVMVDEATKATVKIDKQDVFGEEVEGATLTLTGKDKNGNTITFEEDSLTVGGNGTAVNTSGEALTWISGNGITEISNLPNGTYTLHEVTAPDGYEVATDITFVIEKGKLTTIDSNTVAEDDVIVMVDEATKATVKIDKQDVSGNEVEGAILKLTGKDKNGNTITFEENSLAVGGNGTALNASGEALVWISGNGITEVSNLPNGTYTLHEVTAPDGYEVATDITFVIENGKLTTVDSNVVAEDDVIVMIDEAKKEETTTSHGEGNSWMDWTETTTSHGEIVKPFDGSETTTSHGEGNSWIDWTETTTTATTKESAAPASETTTTETTETTTTTTNTNTETTTTTDTTTTETTTTTSTTTLISSSSSTARTNTVRNTTVRTNTNTASRSTTPATNRTTSNNTPASASPKTGSREIEVTISLLAVSGIALFLTRRKDDE
ncbi:MAG: hypothetical protein K2H89_09225, partial [Oscillospiraceae bacterium]|nr:hypothetical protein [Oscillospiraceae bacterium]